MYAIIRTGGKQYTVKPGDVIRVEKLEQALGAEFNLSDILMIGGDKPVVGAPTVKNASVTVVVTKQTKDKKVIVFKKKRRQGYRRFKTHRQPFTELFVKAISVDGQTSKADGSAQVVDVDQRRQDRLAARSAEAAARVAPEARKAAKKETVKAAPKAKAKAKKPAAKKATAAKKKTTKKA